MVMLIDSILSHTLLQYYIYIGCLMKIQMLQVFDSEAIKDFERW